MDLDFVRLECEVISHTPAQLSAALYSNLRVFEAEFKASGCLDLQETCISCRLQTCCPYRIIFGQQLSSDSEIVRRHQKPSLPFSLYISGTEGATSSCTVGLVIIGSAVNFIEFFYTALVRTVEAALRAILPLTEFSLGFYSLDYNNVRHEIRGGEPLTESIILLSGQHILQNTVHSDSAKLSLLSTLLLLHNGSIARRFDFGVFLRSQLRRCSSLWAYYGTGELELDFVRLSETAEKISVTEDKISYAQPTWSKRTNRAGLTGSAKLAGLPEPMLSLLLLGSYFNAGKGASFGSGFHQLEVL